MAILNTNIATPAGDATTALLDLARGASVELAPRQVAAVDHLADYLPLGTRVYVPFVPDAHWQDTILACERLGGGGMVPVPHLPARSVSGPTELDEWLGRLTEAGVTELMLVAGDRNEPAGVYRDTLDILDTGALAAHGLTRLGVTGYPDGHPLASVADLEAALVRKMEYATATGTEMWIVSQFAFDPLPVIAWIQRIQQLANGLPLRIGIAGPARLKTLLGFAARCGVGVSAKMIARRPSVVRLLNNWSPDVMIGALGRHRAASLEVPALEAPSLEAPSLEAPSLAPSIAGIHLFTFGGLPQTSRWLRAKAGVGTAHVVDFRGVGERGVR